ncbi:hypothetical protein GALMADRAFT_209935 [Galerina marginata CBS 339.88]|uniref:Uncharacterized protein n=1 Tax=Galerina marginata (strain CBS 339.88) TaxID=685588 RepID=A0A067T387_GALM3|nr:hypothetical protein GALMADRAFT_209935 [Galerina marginata CBS 339.88]
MPVGIVEVINNTTGVLHYQNEESGYTFPPINPLSHFSGGVDAWLPKSTFHDDRVPFRSSGKFINVWINDGPKMQISDNDWHFSVIGPFEHSVDRVESRVGVDGLCNGCQYILKVDQAGAKQAYFDFIKYERSKFQTTDAGQVISNTLLETTPTIGQALLDIIL